MHCGIAEEPLRDEATERARCSASGEMLANIAAWLATLERQVQAAVVSGYLR